ncbi:lycopene cyclase, partial [Pelagibacterales bacterium SAG-MED46]|nr:lycopene cyclase [Pelagibacterales bacterium SAG-MED46]
MKEFDYIIIGGGCAGLSLAYELEINNKLANKTLAIIEPRDEYKRDKTWSFWKVFSHNFDDCIKKSWDDFTINTPNETKHIDCKSTPYQTIDSGLFYEKILTKLKLNNNIQYFKNTNEIDVTNSIIFNSVPKFENKPGNLWQHFCGVEIETDKDFFDDQIFNLMDFACDQRNKVHFFYTLPFTKRSALIETTWISELTDEKLKDYDDQIDNYLSNHLKIRNCKINFKETGAIPLFRQKNIKDFNQIFIGSAGGMTRLSTGYTFLNIQEQSRYIRKNIENITNVNIFEIKKKYDFLDKILLKVLKNNSA